MRSRIHVWLVTIALLAPALVQAAGTCYQWRLASQSYNGSSTYTTPWLPSAAEAADNFRDTVCASIMANSSTGTGTQYRNCRYDNFKLGGSGFPQYTFRMRVQQCSNTGGTACANDANWAEAVSTTFTLASQADPIGCPECAQQGTEKTLDGATGTAPSSTCVNGCLYNRAGPYINFSASASGLSGYIGTYQSSGTACQQVSGSTQPQSTQNDCKATSTDVYCMVKNQNGENCGQVNGEWFCAKSTQPGACSSTNSGGQVCGSNRTDGKTETPPGPDTGTAGEPATPTASVKDDSTGRITNYYNSATVNGSTASSSSSSGGSSSSSSGGSSSSSSSSSSTCTGDCDFDGPENAEVGTVAETGNSFVARLYNAPIVASVSSVGASLPAGVCPQGTLNLFGTSITMDMHCTLMSDIAPVISAVMLACWCFLGLRILMSA